MICSNCGNSIESFNKFCPKCGTPAPLPAPPTTGPAYNPPKQPMYSGPVPPPPRKSSCGKIILILGIILVLLLAGIAAALYFGYGWVEGKLKSSEPYKIALTALKENAQVKEKMGEIQETGFPIGFYNEDANGTGESVFTMSVKGTLTSGQYQVELSRSDSKWRIKQGHVRLANGETIDITDQSDVDTYLDTNLNDNSPPLEETNSSGRTISGGVLNGKAISLPKPAYPQIAKQVKASGNVVVQVVVDEKGNVVSARPVSGHPLLHAPAVAAARMAKFSPTKVSGRPVRVSGVITYNFAQQEGQ